LPWSAISEDAVLLLAHSGRRGWPDPNAGIVLAAGAGAIVCASGMPVQEVDGMHPRPELGIGEPADAPFSRQYRGPGLARAGGLGAAC